MKILPRTLFLRSLLIITLPVVLLQLFVAFIFLDKHWEAVTHRLAEAIGREISLTIELIDDYPPHDTKALLEKVSARTGIEFTLRRGLDNFVDDPTQRGVLTRMVASEVKHTINYPVQVLESPDGRSYEINVVTTHGLLRAVVPRRRVFTATTYGFIMWFSGVGILLLIISIAFMRNQIRPIRRLAVAAENFGRGIDMPKFRMEGAREVRRAGAAFLLMRDRIRRQMTQRTEMLAGVSHDLRTPLTRMKLQLAMMHDTDVAELQHDIHDMEQMITAYLAFAKGEGEEPSAIINLNHVLQQAVADIPTAPDKHIALNHVPSLLITLRPQAMRRALVNIIGNAVRYAHYVTINVNITDEAVQIIIDDDGPGIVETMREDVFRPFFRLEQSRNLATGGVGLGLSIARDIVRGHGGEIVLSNGPASGLRVVVQLPR